MGIRSLRQRTGEAMIGFGTSAEVEGAIEDQFHNPRGLSPFPGLAERTGSTIAKLGKFVLPKTEREGE